ncbi:hypothetical protein MKK84_32880 [Methylobacterium sp. E-065]|nr:hypothetical protein [Methylobacterium sp. E-065]MCJ2022144.1 hypothetical protein [Methylobacterium sp. E-065]
MLTALDLYLSHASATSLVVHGFLGIVAVFGTVFGAGSLADHVAAVRATR